MHELILRSYVCLATLSAPQRRPRDRGQTAAEYLGIVVLIGAIITAIFALKIDETIATALQNAVKAVTGGEKPPSKKG